MPTIDKWSSQEWVEKIGTWYLPDKRTGCWNWARAMRGGYGVMANGKNGCMSAHRVSYALLRGPIPEGLTIDHLCRNTSCVNPEHMEPVPAGVNTLRGFGPTANNARKTHCKNGHPLCGENLKVEQGSRRRCRKCASAYRRAYEKEHYDPAKRRAKHDKAQARRKNVHTNMS